MKDISTQVWAVDALGALAHETRLAVFRMLVKAGPDGMIAGAIGAGCIPTLAKAESAGEPTNTLKSAMASGRGSNRACGSVTVRFVSSCGCFGS